MLTSFLSLCIFLIIFLFPLCLVVFKMGNNWLLLLLPVYIAIDKTFAQSCGGFDCLEEYVNAPDDAFTWSDTGMKEINVVFK